MKRHAAPLRLARRLAFARACLGSCCVGAFLIAGCSSRPIETGMSGRAAEMPVAADAVHAAGPGAVGPGAAGSDARRHRPVRPIPEVIAKAKPFRMLQATSVRPLMAAADPQPSRAAIASGVETVSAVMPPQALSQSATGMDVAGITNMMQSYLQAFNRHDSAALAAHWSAAGENVDLDSGETTAGREAVRDVFTALFEQDAGATIDIDIASIRPLREDVAVIDGVSRISFTDAPPSSSRFSAVLVRQDGRWVLDTVRESTTSSQQAEPESVRQPPAKPLDALAWLVGSWEDVSEGVTASTHCFWSTNKAFLIRSHLISANAVPEQRPLPGDSRIPGLLPAGPAGNREITEIIGWDQDRGQIRSWLFTSDGRSAEGSWSRSPDGNVWTVRMAGPAASECVSTLTRMGPDEMACQCSVGECADVMPPACDFVRTARAGDEQSSAERR